MGSPATGQQLNHFRSDARGAIDRSQAEFKSSIRNVFGRPVDYLYAPDQRLVQINSGGSPLASYAYLDGQPLARIDGSAANSPIYYFHNHPLGVPLKASNAAGQTAWAAQLQPFGLMQTTTAAISQNLRFPGQYFDAESGLHYNMARYYSPELGRYLQSDPIGLAGGINTYTYVYNNPLCYIDPLGLDVIININRTTYTPTSIVGTIDVSSTVTNQTFSGNTLENAAPPNQNLPVPPGTYSAFVRTDYTPNRIQLNNVPQAFGVQIHKGNTSNDVVGCFAAGTSTSPNFVGGSGNAMNQINNIISADGTGNITVIVNGVTSAPTPGQ